MITELIDDLRRVLADIWNRIPWQVQALMALALLVEVLLFLVAS